jgi:integrase
VLERIHVEKLEPQILTPAQVLDALEFTRRKNPRFLAWLALAVFAGVRPDELGRITLAGR